MQGNEHGRIQYRKGVGPELAGPAGAQDLDGWPPRLARMGGRMGSWPRLAAAAAAAVAGLRRCPGHAADDPAEAPPGLQQQPPQRPWPHVEWAGSRRGAATTAGDAAEEVAVGGADAPSLASGSTGLRTPPSACRLSTERDYEMRFERGHHCVKLPEAISQKRLNVPGPKLISAKRA
eukprot:1149895-Pelagomonas_calceolata.AAC.1